VLATAARLYWRYLWLFLLLALIVVAPYDLIVLAATGTAPLGQQSGSLSTAVTLLLLQFALVIPFVSALDVRAVAEIAAGRSPRPDRVTADGLRVLPVVVAAQIIADLGIGAGLLAFVLPGIILAVRWAVVAQVAAIERTDWMGALRRGLALTRGNFFHVLGVLVVPGVLTYLIVALGVSLTGTHSGPAQVVLGIALDTITRSFSALTTAVLYFELTERTRREV
jgi:hypothetical protein